MTTLGRVYSKFGYQSFQAGAGVGSSKTIIAPAALKSSGVNFRPSSGAFVPGSLLSSRGKGDEGLEPCAGTLAPRPRCSNRGITWRTAQRIDLFFFSLFLESEYPSPVPALHRVSSASLSGGLSLFSFLSFSFMFSLNRLLNRPSTGTDHEQAQTQYNTQPTPVS